VRHAHARRQVLPIEELIQLELDQHLVPEARAGHPFRGEGLLGAMSQGREDVFGQHGTDLGHVLSSLLFLTLAAMLRVDSHLRLPFGLFGFRMSFPRRQRLREKVLCPSERLDGEVDRLRGQHDMMNDERRALRPIGRQVILSQGFFLGCRLIDEVKLAGELGIK
jgi:hypothetical protein